jgi:serine/threonine protein kinase
MDSPASFYCATCGAANQEQATYCFSCGGPLHTPVEETLLKQRYRVIGPIGRGGFGAVYKAEDTQSGNCLVAIKEINLSDLKPQEILEATDAFNREVLLLSGLIHPNLPRIHDHFTGSEYWYLVLDFIAGETLEQYLGRAQSRASQALGLPLNEVLDIGIQLCTVLDYLHTREPPIIFRDLKPANVMRTADGHLYLIDFGIARRFKPGQARDTVPLGSPGYAAPEQYGRAQTTSQADIYSLGALLHQLLTGDDPTQTPFRFASLQLRSQAGLEYFQPLLLQMVEMDANRRPDSIATVKQELQQIATLLRPIGTILFTYRGHSRLVLAAAWSPDGTHIASGSFDGTMQIWNATTGCRTFIYRNPSKPYTWVWSLAWSPDGKYIASGSDDKTAQVWQVEENEKRPPTVSHVLTYRGHSNWVNAVTWSPDGRYIASGSDDRTVHVWQMDIADAPNQVLQVYRGHSRWVITVAWSHDGNFIASGGNDGTVQVWDVTQGNGMQGAALIYRGHSSGVNAVIWSPDGTRIASCSWDNIVHVWDVTTGYTILTYCGHSQSVNTIAWSPDGIYIASAGKDKTVQVWNATTGDTIFTYRGHTGWVYTVSWSPDGTRIASGGNDKTVQVWRAV